MFTRCLAVHGIGVGVIRNGGMGVVWEEGIGDKNNLVFSAFVDSLVYRH